jgi:hypothetical protein
MKEKGRKRKSNRLEEWSANEFQSVRFDVCVEPIDGTEAENASLAGYFRCLFDEVVKTLDQYNPPLDTCPMGGWWADWLCGRRTIPYFTFRTTNAKNRGFVIPCQIRHEDLYILLQARKTFVSSFTDWHFVNVNPNEFTEDDWMFAALFVWDALKTAYRKIVESWKATESWTIDGSWKKVRAGWRNLRVRLDLVFIRDGIRLDSVNLDTIEPTEK